MPNPSTRHLLLTPGPTPIPEPVQQALNRNSSDISAPAFTAFTRRCIDGLRPLFNTAGEVFAYIANGHGAWEAALVNALAPGDRVLVAGSGHFADHWATMARALGLIVELTDNDWRSPADVAAVAARLRADRERTIRALLLVHADTATGIANPVPAFRRALDDADHPALLMLDAVATLGCVEVATDLWGVDVCVAASQKGLMSPPGLAFVAVSEKARAVAERAPGSPRLYWDWRLRRDEEWYRWFCGTAPTQLVHALGAALDLIYAEGLDAVYARHRRIAAAARAAVAVWAQAGTLELNARDPAAAADSVTTVRVVDGIDAGRIKQVCYDRFNVSLGGGLSRLHGRAFRIGHMGSIGEASLLAGLGCIETTLRLCDIDYRCGGVDAAVASLAGSLCDTDPTAQGRSN